HFDEPRHLAGGRVTAERVRKLFHRLQFGPGLLADVLIIFRPAPASGRAGHEKYTEHRGQKKTHLSPPGAKVGLVNRLRVLFSLREFSTAGLNWRTRRVGITFHERRTESEG